jgi:hypothetical protein
MHSFSRFFHLSQDLKTTSRLFLDIYETKAKGDSIKRKKSLFNLQIEAFLCGNELYKTEIVLDEKLAQKSNDNFGRFLISLSLNEKKELIN